MLPSISPSIRPSTSPHCFALNISLPQRAQVLSITSAHTNTYSMCTTRTLKYRVSSVPNCRKGDGGSEISQQHGAVHAHLCVCVSFQLLVSWCLPVTSRRAALMLWLQCLGAQRIKETVEITVQLAYFIRVSQSHILKQQLKLFEWTFGDFSFRRPEKLFEMWLLQRVKVAPIGGCNQTLNQLVKCCVYYESALEQSQLFYCASIQIQQNTGLRF